MYQCLQHHIRLVFHVFCVNTIAPTDLPVCDHIYTHPKVSGKDVVGGDHHILSGQKLFAPVAIGAVIQIDVQLHVRTHMLLKLILLTRKWKKRGKKT